MNSAGAQNSSGSGGASGGAANGGSASAGRGGMPASGSGGSLGGAGSAGSAAGSGGKAGSSAAAGSGGTGGSTGGGGASAGSGGAKAGSGGASAGSGGASAGNSGSAGSGTVVDTLLSRGKTASADSNEAGHPAGDGNDLSLTTRWCAANGATGHNWRVDLGELRTLSQLQITWEKAVNYRFKVEGSEDGSVWKLVLDRTTTTSTAAMQTHPLSGAPQARWVRITVTTLPDPNTWASFFDFSVFGH